jgi:spore coat protein A, manganese oxidase
MPAFAEKETTMRQVTWKFIPFLAALALLVTGLGMAYAQPVPGGTLDPTTVPKYVTPLVIPPAIPKSTPPMGFAGDYYEIAVREFTPNILPASMNKPTKVWSYCSKSDVAGTLNYPAFTIEATYGTPVRVKWINELRLNPDDPASNYLSHFLPVDPTLHWANPPQGSDPAYGDGARDTRPTFSSTPGHYTGPVPIVTHVHGAHVADDSDGYAEAWTLPAAGNIPAGYATSGTWYDFFKPKAEAAYGQTWDAGSMVFQYPNNQRATTLWYHDHTLGMTRLNVYAGPAGFYIIRGGPDGDAAVIDKKTRSSAVLPGPAPQLGDAPGLVYREIPIVIQDRSFNNDGSLFFPDNRAFFEALNVPPAVPYLDIPFIGANACNGQPSDISPAWNPEFFGNTMVVNGKTWPVLNVEQRRYRFRFLNGCNSRFVILRLVTDGNATAGIDDGVVSPPILNAFAQIGSEGGFLPKVANQSEILIGLAERADTIIDFGKFPVGTELYMVNVGPDTPFGGGVLGVDFFASVYSDCQKFFPIKR